MAGAFSLGLPLRAKIQQHPAALHSVRPASRLRRTSFCRSQLAGGPTEDGVGQEKGRDVRSREGRGGWWGLVVKKGREVKESLQSPPPKQKGDWKDLVLMSFSFAVYVYVSQKIVCAYCAWISMINHR